MYAIKENKENIACALLDAGADYNIIDCNGQSALFFAAVSGHESVAQRLIEGGADLNIPDNLGKTALMYAIEKNKESIACALLDAGADNNIIDGNGQSALFFAAVNGNESVVQRLIKAGTDLNITDEQGRTALIYAIKENKENIACALLDAGADYNITDCNGQSVLFFTAVSGNEIVVQRLIKAGIDLNITDNQGRTALICAMRYGRNKRDMAAELIKAGADVNMTDYKGKSALIYYAQKRKRDTGIHDYCYEERDGDKTAIMMIEAGADVDVTDNKGKTALMYAVKNKCEHLACTLIDAGGNVNITNKQGNSALSYSVPTGTKYFFKYIFNRDRASVSENIACKLIKAGADVNLISDEGKTILLYAVQYESMRLVDALIEAGADVNVTDIYGKSALSYSVETDRYKKNPIYYAVTDSNTFTASESITCKLIKAAGANVDITGDKGKTPLMDAVLYNNKMLTNALIEAGANVNKSDYYGQTALFYGLRNQDIIHALIENGHAIVNKRDRYGRSVLFYSFAESLDSTNYLLEKGGNLNVKDNCSMSIISFWIENLMARKEGFSVHFRKIYTLLEERIQPNAIFEAIINAVFCKIFQCGAFPTRKGRKRTAAPAYFDLNTSIFKEHNFDPGNNIEAMHSAKKYIAGQAATQRERLENVIEMMKEDRYLYTNLQKIADVLVELGANPNYADSDGNTALHYATCLPLIEPHETTVAMTIWRKLEELGASLHAKNHQYETPLLFCLSEKEWINTSQTSSKVKNLVQVCNFLLEHGSSIEETTRSGKTVFHLILELFEESLGLNDKRVGKEVLVETLKLLELFPCSRPLIITTEVTVNKRDSNLNSPLHVWAALKLHLSSENDSIVVDHNTLKKNILGTIFRHLGACGVKLNGRNKNDETPLHLCRSWTAVKLLIDAGATPKVLDSEGSSPLLLEMEGIFMNDGYIYQEDVSQEPKAFWKTVLDHNLDPWVVNNHGSSVLSVLIKEGAFDLSKALVEVACEENYIQSDTIAVSLLNAVCLDRSIHKEWKSILVELILKSRKAKPISFARNDDTALHLSCRNIVRLLVGKASLFDEEERFYFNGVEVTSVSSTFSDYDDDKMFYDYYEYGYSVNSAKMSVHWSITKQLLTYRMDYNALDASGQSCLDIAKRFPALKSLLLKPIDIDEVPLAFPWTSISTRYKPILSKVARRQECKPLDLYWYHDTYIQKGSFGLVFVGMNEKDGREVAIKRIEKLRNQQLEADKKEIQNLTALADCEQVVRYLSFTEDEHFCYVILELMEGNLNDYLEGAAFDDKKSVQLCGDVLKGLKYLHQENILHRDLKPSNILFKTYPKLCLKIANFGLSRRIDTLGTYTTSSGSVVGTRCWIAPEVLKCSSKKTKHQRACDVFSAGLVLYYILSGKKHPFFPADCENKSDLQISNETEANIIHGRMEGFKDTHCSPEATDLVHSMLDSDPTKRPTAAIRLTHPFFWSEKKKMDFLSAVGNQPEIEFPRAYLHKRTLPLSIVEKELDGKLKSIIMTHPTWDDWKYVHMPAIYMEMTKTRKAYNTSSVVELVRFIRNTLAHVSEDTRPTLIRKLVLEDFVFLEYFPNLFMEVYKCVKMHGWDSREEIKYQLS